MVRQQRASKVHEDRYPLCQGKDELVKHDMLDPPRYLRRSKEDSPGKALSFGVLDWKQMEKWKDTNAEGSKGSCCSYEDTAASSLELDLSTGVIKRLEVDLKSQHMRNHSFSLRSQACSVAMDADTMMRMDQKGKRDHQLLSMKQKEQQASLNKSLVKKELSNASEISLCTSPGSETSSKLLSDVSSTVEDRRHDVQGEFSSPANVIERNKNFVEKPCLLEQNIHTLTSKKARDASPNRRFSFSFSQMSRSFSSKESSSSLSSVSNASAKSGPLTFTDSVYPNHSTRAKQKGHSRSRSGPILKPKTEKRSVPLASKPSNTKPPTMEKKQCSSRVHALLQFTLRKGINLFQFVVGDNNDNNVLAATMKSSDSSSRSYTLYTINEVKNKSGNWLGRHKNEHPFVHTTIGQMKTVTSYTSEDSSIHKSESVLFSPSTNEELAAIVQTRNMSQRQNKTTIILPSGAHTLPKDSNNSPLPLIERWRSGGACDCGGWDIGCKLRVISNDHTKSHTFSSYFQLFDQEGDEPVFKIVSHGDELHSVEFSSSVTLLEAFFISLAVTSHQSWCQEKEEEVVLIGDGLLKRETPAKYATNPPVSPIGRV
ncbi:hypothetical protein CARUB_v10022857mg [Capsella rubella]|uniref:DUF3527 domain-containing protein n=1 Tax=Capsella rubella TaxID=81985 RepID=R0HNE4_9BRAS|nr:uncharacterized protein LOC17889997 [Capsella rubella]EOA26770.1 hypothetical protein CARUB_v10022857mg [Capsella rubella]EOA26771.1 hypothetical protein CARUB_v10022857mg [Capsella rubella]